jgi:hypothetical protein
MVDIAANVTDETDLQNAIKQIDLDSQADAGESAIASRRPRIS